MNVMASPAPTSTRAATAAGTSVARRASCPAAIVSAPARIIRREPKPVQGHADRHLQGGVDGQLQHEEQRDHGGAGGEPLLRLDGGDAQRRAVEDGDHVGQQGDAHTHRRGRTAHEGRAASPVVAHTPGGHHGRAEQLPCGTVNSLTGPSGLPVSAMQTLVDPADDPAVDDGPRRGRILWALATCMATKGYQATTFADIARAAPGVEDRGVRALPRQGALPPRAVLPGQRPVLETVRAAPGGGPRADLPWRDRLRAVIAAYLETLAAGPAVAWAALVEVQAAGRPALTLRRGMIDRYVDLLTEVAAELAESSPTRCARSPGSCWSPPSAASTS